MDDTWMTHGTEARIYDEPSGRNWDREDWNEMEIMELAELGP